MVSNVNSPDSFLNGFIRLSGLTVQGSSYFFKVSSTPDIDNKILSTVESGFEAQNSLKFCPEYRNVKQSFLWFTNFKESKIMLISSLTSVCTRNGGIRCLS
jgi:hypothetical protein